MSHPVGELQPGSKLPPPPPLARGSGKRAATPATQGAHVLFPSVLGPTELEQSKRRPEAGVRWRMGILGAAC